jgi:hypothetical protein
MVAEISFGGIGLYLVSPPEVGSKVRIEIRFLVAGGVNTATVKGTTIYAKFIQDTYYVGIQFDQELDTKSQPALYSRLKDILEQYNDA